MTDLYEDITKAQIQDLANRIGQIENEETRNNLLTIAFDSLNSVKSGESFGKTANPAIPVATVGYMPSEPVLPGASRTEHIDEALTPIAPTSPPSPVTAQPNYTVPPVPGDAKPDAPKSEASAPPAPPLPEPVPVMPKVVPVVESARVVHPAKGDSSKK